MIGRKRYRTRRQIAVALLSSLAIAPAFQSAGAQEGDTGRQATLASILVATNRPQLTLNSTVAADPAGNSETLRFALAEIRQPPRDTVAPTNLAEQGFSFKTVMIPPQITNSTYALHQLSELAPSEFAEATSSLANGTQHFRGKLLVFIHGFNTSFEDALLTAARAAMAYRYDGAMIAFSWPSAGSITRYKQDQAAARASGKALADLLAATSRMRGITELYVIAHSMGNLVAMEALRAAAERHDFTLEHYMLCAPDLDATEFAREFPIVSRFSRRFTLYATVNDLALLASEKLNRGLRLGKFDESRILTLDKLHTIDASKGNMDLISGRHFRYQTLDLGLAQDFMLILKGASLQEPHLRNPRMTPRGNGSAKYWQYAPN